MGLTQAERADRLADLLLAAIFQAQAVKGVPEESNDCPSDVVPAKRRRRYVKNQSDGKEVRPGGAANES